MNELVERFDDLIFRFNKLNEVNFMKTARTAVKAKTTRRKSEHRNPRTCYCVSKDKRHVYRFVNHAQRLDFLLRDKLIPIDALTYRAMTNADVTGKLIYHDMRGVPFTTPTEPLGTKSNVVSPSTGDVQELLETFKTGVASILSDFSTKLEQFTPQAHGQGSIVERLSPSH